MRGLHLPEVGGDNTERSHKLRHILVGGKSQRRGGSIQHIIFGCAQVIRQRAPGIAAEIRAVHDLIVSGGIPCAGVDLFKAHRLDGQGIAPVKGFQRRGGIVGNAGKVVADKLPRHDLHVAGFLDRHIRVQALIGHGCLDDLTGILNFYLNGHLIQPVKLRRLGFHDLIPRQRQRLAHRQAVFVRLDRIHQPVGAGVVDLKDSVGDGCPGRPAIHGIIVRRGLDDLDLAGDGRILPLDFCGFAGLYIHGLFLRVGNISLIFKLTQIKTACGEALKTDITAVIAGFLRDGIVAGIVQNERNAVDTLAGGRIDLMDQDTGDGFVGHRFGCGFAILHSEINRGIVQLEALARLGFHGIVAAACQRHIHAAVRSSGDGVHQTAIADTADLEGGVGDALGLVRRIHFHQLQPADGSIIKIE